MLLHCLRFAGLVSLLWVVPALAQSSPPASAWVAALRDGGYVIVLRHGATYTDQADTNPLDPKDTAHQRQLNDAGRAAAKSMGDALRTLKIPVGKVQTSQFQRAVETGTLLGFGEASPTADLAGLWFLALRREPPTDRRGGRRVAVGHAQQTPDAGSA